MLTAAVAVILTLIAAAAGYDHWYFNEKYMTLENSGMYVKNNSLYSSNNLINRMKVQYTEDGKTEFVYAIDAPYAGTLELKGDDMLFIRTRAIPLRLFKEAIRVVTEPPHEEGEVSSFRALMVSTASRVGVGNIAGVATAVAAGGAGAVFWMWVIATLGGASAFIESTLAQIYKKQGPTLLRWSGYYIQTALKQNWLATLSRRCSF